MTITKKKKGSCKLVDNECSTTKEANCEFDAEIEFEALSPDEGCVCTYSLTVGSGGAVGATGYTVPDTLTAQVPAIVECGADYRFEIDESPSPTGCGFGSTIVSIEYNCGACPES